jgi:hypothetical protein
MTPHSTGWLDSDAIRATRRGPAALDLVAAYHLLLRKNPVNLDECFYSLGRTNIRLALFTISDDPTTKEEMN